MTSRIALSTIAGVALLSLTLLPARVAAAPIAGDNEIEISGGFFHAQGSRVGSLNADVHYGYYLTPNWEVGLRQALNYNFVERARDQWQASTTPFVLFNFPLGDVLVPFVGAHLGVVWNDIDHTGTLGPTGGVKLFFSPQTYFKAGYRYEWFFDRFRRIGDRADRGNHVVNLGLGYVWGGVGPRPGVTPVKAAPIKP